MRPKLLLLISVITLAVFTHYWLKHHTISYLNVNSDLEEKLTSEKELNKDLTTEYNSLQAYSRIISKAKNELGMILPPNDSENVLTVQKTGNRNQRVFRFIDYITPSAEAVSN